MPPETLEETRLAALTALDLVGSGREERFDRVTRLAKRLFEVDGAAVHLLTRDRQVSKSHAGIGPLDMERADSVCTVAIQGDDVLQVPDLQDDERFQSRGFVTGAPHLRFYAGQPLKAPGGARVGTLCLFDTRPRTLTSGEFALLRDLALWVEKEMARDEELEKAAQVQRGLLPAAPPQLHGYDVAGACLSSREVGGDLLDWYPAAGRLALTVADVMGKGMPAAIMMATLRAVLRAGTRAGDVADAVALGAETMEADFGETGAFATLLHGLLDAEAGRFSYVDAGHGLAVVVDVEGEVRALPVRGLPAGAVPGASWEAGEEDIAPGEALVVFSDGLLDLHRDREACERQVREAVVTTSTAAEAVGHLTWAARSLALPDDVTVLVLRRTG